MEENLDNIIKEYPYLAKKCEEAIILPCDKLKQTIKTSEKVDIDGTLVYIDLVEYIVTNDDCYSRILSHFKSSNDSLEITSISYGDTTNSVRYTKIILLSSIEFLLNFSQPNINLIEKYNELLCLVDYNKIKNVNKSMIFKIDGENVNVELSDIFALYELSEKKYLELLFNKKVTHINNIKKEHLIYASLIYFNNIRIFDNYLVPDSIIDRYKCNVRSEIIDIEAIGTFRVTKDTLYKKITINEELENEILKDIPSEYNNLEKAIHIYIKMCKLFTYDEEYYVKSYKGEFNSKHRKIDYVKEITLQNNRVVCYEFNIIYSKLLNDLNIIFESDYQNMLGETYGYSHVFLRYRFEKFLIKADSVKGIIGGDIAKIKINNEINGIECYNESAKTQDEFKYTLKKVYDNIKKTESNSFNFIVEEYKKISDNIKPIAFSEKFMILNNKLKVVNLTGVDAMSYLIDLFKRLFTTLEKSENINLTIVKNNEEYNSGNLLEAIIAINESSFYNNADLTKYYLYKPTTGLIEIDKNILVYSLECKKLNYVEKKNVKIPGIYSLNKGGQR